MLFSLVAVLGSPSVSAKPLTNYNVLILKNSNAWSSPSVENILTDMSIPYDVMTSTELQNKTAQELIGTYDMIIIVSDQGQQFYNEIGPQMGKLGEYVKAGNVLEIHAANWGWNGGLWTTPLPGNVTITQSYSPYDYVIANNTTLISNYASHGYLIGLPANAEIITVQAPGGSPDYGKPSTAVYAFGNGKVFVTGLTIEYSVARKGPEWKAFYKEVIINNLGYSSMAPTPEVSGQKGINVMLFNFYYYIQYHRNLDKYNTLYGEAVDGGMDNETLRLATVQNDTAAEYYANASQYGPVVANFPRIYIFIDLRKAALHQKQAVGILEEGMADW
ncbi:pyrolysin [Thermococcus sp. MAR1]|uniref:pyrolysin n=1 Tax=Thermococcus sp. MAR1 TaxID=1638263 RepID=UPI001F113D8D|nr:pyrolysin [Thermococcus sp. MAR1]